MADKIAEHMALVWDYADMSRSGATFSERHEAYKAIEASARALAQGEPGEAKFQAIYFRRNTGIDRLIVPAGEDPGHHVERSLITKIDLLYLPSTASAPAAERPPYCGSGHCSCIECPYAAPVTIKGGNE